MMDIPTQPMFDSDSRPRRVVADDTLVHVPRALVIESSPEGGALIQQALSDLSFIGVVEANSSSALRRYAHLNPAVVFIDLDLPDLAGWEVLDVLKEARPDGKRPIIIVVASPDSPVNLILGRLQGVDGRLIKPFTHLSVQKAVQEALTARRRSGGLLPTALLRRSPTQP